MHDDMPRCGAMWPARHTVQLIAPNSIEGMYFPLSHSVQWVLPVLLAYLPASQARHDVAQGGEITFANLPKGHSVQTPNGARPSRYVPGAHHWVGVDEGTGDGTGVGSADGGRVGRGLGSSVGRALGRFVGTLLGDGLGTRVGSAVGAGVIVGNAVGRELGWRDIVGIEVGFQSDVGGGVG